MPLNWGFLYRSNKNLYLSELIINELQQDAWSSYGPTFGANQQLRVVGWSGKRKADKIYILHCSECAKDQELYGEGYFKSLKFSLIRGKPQIPCGCAEHVHWTEAQYVVLAKRKLDRLGIEFLGWDGPYKKADTKVRLKCSLHGEWVGTRVGAIISQTTDKGNCIKCGNEAGAITRTKDESYFKESFMKTGKFEVDTTFRFIGYKPFTSVRRWEVYCSRCSVTFESTSASLQMGKVGCTCSWGFNQKQAYINQVFYGDLILGLKFGISVNAESRSKNFQRSKDYTIRLACVYQFSSVGDCRNAEKYCKKALPCVIFSKEMLPDGYTETTYPHYYDEITKIYEDFGGKVVDFSLD